MASRRSWLPAANGGGVEVVLGDGEVVLRAQRDAVGPMEETASSGASGNGEGRATGGGRSRVVIGDDVSLHEREGKMSQGVRQDEGNREEPKGGGAAHRQRRK